MLKYSSYILFTLIISCSELTDDQYEQIRTSSFFSALTYNVYIGMDVDRLFSAKNQEDLLSTATELYSELVKTNFYERADKIAFNISRYKPIVISLQEITTVYSQSPSDNIFGGTDAASQLEYDYLQILLDAMKKYGLNYHISGKIKNTEVELPIYSKSSVNNYTDIRIEDYDVCLLNSDYNFKNARNANFNSTLKYEELGIEIKRGYIIFECNIEGINYRLVNTHLEADEQSVRIKQMNELQLLLAKETKATLLMGDFNSPAANGRVYHSLIKSGYKDLWLVDSLYSKENGHTSLQDPDLLNKNSKLFERIDFIFTKDISFQLHDIRTIGANPQDKTANGLWPSDHAGIYTLFKTYKTGASQ